MRHSLLIYNPAAGLRRRRRPPEEVRRLLADDGWDARLLVTRGQDHATELVHRHLSGDVEAVWSYGGDGTLGQVATALVGSAVPIGILPAGTGNVIAKECGIPKGLADAVRALAPLRVERRFRTWSVDGRAVVLGVGVGFGARTIGRASQRLKERIGMLAFGARGVLEWARYEFPPLRVRGEDERGRSFDLPATQATATNSARYAGPFPLVPAADPEDRLLDVVLFQGRSRLQLAAFWLGQETPGSLQLRVPAIRTLRARRLEIRAEAGYPVEAHVNGDMVSHTPVTAERWGTVRLLTPASRDGGDREAPAVPS
jgi:diacylglycerol kinase (ATP)